MNRVCLVLGTLVILLMLTAAGAAWAQAPSEAQSPQQTYDLRWQTVDGGGYTWSSGGTYALGGTIGQPDAGNLAAGTYALGGGFWHRMPAAQARHRFYLPVVLRSYMP
ncbi:MAG TPA: hypothetical protein VLC95_03010 [Anaerolineae bacterium]|nr:hypothetical protein [Anaerolineae bacterium]